MPAADTTSASARAGDEQRAAVDQICGCNGRTRGAVAPSMMVTIIFVSVAHGVCGLCGAASQSGTVPYD